MRPTRLRSEPARPPDGSVVVRRRGRRTVAGMTLLEVMIALAILAAGLLAMLAMQISAMRGGRAGRDVTEAARIAQDQMELLHRVDWTDPQMNPTAWTVPTVVNGAVTGAGPALAQAYNLSWRIQATADPNLRLVDVRVTWQEPNQPPGAPPRRYAVSTARHNDP